MTARIAITRHAAERITQRLEPVLGDAATGIVTEAVLDAAWNFRWRRKAPRWLASADKRRDEQVRYVVGNHRGVRFTAVVSLSDPTLPRLITILTDRTTAPALALLPELADGRVIGKLRTTPLPVAFQQVAA